MSDIWCKICEMAAVFVLVHVEESVILKLQEEVSF